ncbi:hypothetical protein ACBR19_21325, partial [Raoultella planticola]|uniref:hypothetical protein n=1 Tax=Raoultella planticola TaxID=575 RepID=UPI0035261FC7
HFVITASLSLLINNAAAFFSEGDGGVLRRVMLASLTRVSGRGGGLNALMPQYFFIGLWDG